MDQHNLEMIHLKCTIRIPAIGCTTPVLLCYADNELHNRISRMTSANSILGKLHIFMKSQAHLFVVKIWLEKAENMVLFCVLRLWHIN